MKNVIILSMKAKEIIKNIFDCFSSVQFSSVQFSSVQFSSVQFSSVLNFKLFSKLCLFYKTFYIFLYIKTLFKFLFEFNKFQTKKIVYSFESFYKYLFHSCNNGYNNSKGFLSIYFIKQRVEM